MKNIELKSQKGLLFLLYFYNYKLKEVYRALNTFEYAENILELEQVDKNLFDNPDETDNVQKKLFLNSLANAEECIHKARLFNIKIMTIYDKEYPEQFAELDDAPPVLFYKGKIHKLDLAAVIGTRNPTKYGEKITKRVISRLSERNFGIVSGLAAGIDTLAHKYSLENNGYTIAILPTSMDKLYPTSNYKLAADIIENGGCVMTEFPFGINKGKFAFIMRNRLVSKLSNCVIPIEMSKSSGTMHTIDFAIKQNTKIISLAPPSDFIKESNKAIEGVLLINQRILNNEILNGTVVSNVEELSEELLSCKKYHDRVFKLNSLIIIEEE